MLIGELKETIRKDFSLQLLLLASLVVQIIICITAVGIYHPDQYFQIIEFSSAQLHRPSAVGHIWEYSAQIRPTLQVYLFSAYYKVCQLLAIRDPYLQLAILRTLFGLLLFVVFNGMVLYYFRSQQRKILYYVLLILNFSWLVPYTRTLYSSEMLSSLLFFGAVFWYTLEKNAGSRRLVPLLTGFLFSLSFYARFQTAFAIIGFGAWMLLFERKPFKILPLVGGFLLGTAINTGLDYSFYHQLVITPYTYYKVNIVEGKAASMGTSSFLLYIGEMVVVLAAPPLSLFLLYSGFRSSIIKKYSHPIFITVIFFIVGHCLVAHKEERFLFPVLNVLPILIGWGLPDFIAWYKTRRKGFRYFIKGIAIFSITLNTIVLALMFVTPYSQALYFTSQLKLTFRDESVTIYTIPHTPFETDARLPFVFYQTGVRNISWIKLSTNDSIRSVSSQAEYITTTYNQIKDNRQLLDSLGYRREVCSSNILWGLNEWLQSKSINTINDIWVLYKRKQR